MVHFSFEWCVNLKLTYRAIFEMKKEKFSTIRLGKHEHILNWQFEFEEDMFKVCSSESCLVDYGMFPDFFKKLQDTNRNVIAFCIIVCFIRAS